MSHTCKLPIVESQCICIVNSEWTTNSVKLSIIHDNQAWSGEFQVEGDEDVAELIDQLSLTEDTYWQQTKNALTTQGGAEHFTYSIESNTFIWKKYLRANMAVKFGYVAIVQVPVFEIFEKITDNSLQANIQISCKLSEVQKQKDALAEENSLLKSKLNELIEQKVEMETTLYSQFLCLINEKKKKIEELNQKLGIVDEENEPDLPQSDNDHFGSETEIDSGEENNSSSNKGPLAASRVSKGKGDNIYSLPKRSRKTENSDSIAGPGKIKQKSNNSKTTKTVNRKTSPAVSKQPGRSRKKAEFDSLVNKVPDILEKKNSEEDAFTFPKRSKRLNNSTTLVKPSTSKIIYASDDAIIDVKKERKEAEVNNSKDKVADILEEKNSEDDACTFPKRPKRLNNSTQLVQPSTSKMIYKSDSESDDKSEDERDDTFVGVKIKSEPESDCTPDLINTLPNDEIVLKIKTEKDAEDNSKSRSAKPEELKRTEKSREEENSSGTNNGSNSIFEEFSSSTLDMLRQLC